jgi:hypothetical protein
MIKIKKVVHYNGALIETDVPLPPKGCGRGSSNKPFKYPFFAMKVGDSFVADHTRVRSAASIYGKNHNQKFTTRTQEDGTTRVWRTA